MAKEILPIPGKRNILITSALPYVNNIPHLGNVIGSVLSADCFARYCKGRDYQCLFICGTDEYGTATETKALEEGVTPEELCAKYNLVHKSVYDWFEIEFDKWGRTPTQEQTDIAQEIFLKLNENGYLQEKTTMQPYCEHPNHMAFLADRYVEGTCPKCAYIDARGDQCDQCGNLLDPLELINPHCKLDGTEPKARETKHMYLSLDKLQEAVDKWQHESYEKGAWSSNGYNIAQSWIKTGLEPRGITRDLKFGTPIPLPGYENKVMYVWFDACIGYVSITATYTKEWEKWWRNPEDVQLYQFMGKDNTPFHAVVFPASQIGTKQKWTMVHHISTTEYLNYEKGKFSKSRGIGVFGTSAAEIGISPDVWRYYLLSHRPETGDSEFEWEAFVLDNNYLLNNLGNLVNRVVKFTASKTYDSVVPDYTKASDPLFDEFKKNVNAKLADYIDAFEKVKLRGALTEAMATSQLGNKLLQDVGLDNRLASEEPEKCAALVGIVLNHLHLIAAIIAPYMPGTSKSILAQLNAQPFAIPTSFTFDTIPAGHNIGAPAYLFTNIKAEKADEWRDQFGGAAAKKAKEEAAKLAAEKKSKKKKEGKEGDKPKVAELSPEEEKAKIAAKKAAKAAKKEKGRLERPGASGGKQPADEGKGVEAAEKEGAVEEGAVEELAEGVKVAHLQSS